MTLDRKSFEKMDSIIDMSIDQKYHLIIEEFGEMGQAMSKVKRGKGIIYSVIDEAMDLLITVYRWLISMGVSDEDIEKFVSMKTDRTLKRYLDHGEL